MSNNSEENKEAIDRLARLIVSRDLSDVARMFLRGFQPAANINAVVLGVSVYPFAMLFGGDIEEYMGLFTFNARENMGRISKRIEELEDEKRSGAKMT
ncbi:hypothetical protein MUP77_16645 [Candidatus Bathyarchaeota archaeon]|nr:hypothetical protein [Candidatus Bathyarchaeota archaeon]